MLDIKLIIALALLLGSISLQDNTGKQTAGGIPIPPRAAAGIGNPN